MPIIPMPTQIWSATHHSNFWYQICNTGISVMNWTPCL